MKRIFACIGIAVFLASFPARVSSWPEYLTHTDEVDYIHLQAEYISTLDLWLYKISIDADAVDPLYGPIVGIKALAVYPESGVSPLEIPKAWDGYDQSAYLRANWDYGAGWETGTAAFGYKTGGPSNYVKPGETLALIGAAQYPTGYTPVELGFLVHIVANDGSNTWWARPEEVIPEPSTLLSLSIGGIWAGAVFIRRRRGPV